jgi:hypothetical protein
MNDASSLIRAGRFLQQLFLCQVSARNNKGAAVYMYTPSCHSIAAYAAVIEADLVAGFFRKLVVVLFEEIRVSILEVTIFGSAEVNGAKT